MPAVLGMRRFLGQLNYNEEFCGRQRKGQLSWEFEDKETKTTFKPTLIGEIATPTYGTLLKENDGRLKQVRNITNRHLENSHISRRQSTTNKAHGSTPQQKSPSCLQDVALTS